MSKNTEGDVAADLAALRQDVARLAETIGKVLQHQTQAAGVGASEAVGDAKDKVADTAARGARFHPRGERRNRGQHRAQSADGGVDRVRRRNVARHDGPIA